MTKALSVERTPSEITSWVIGGGAPTSRLGTPISYGICMVTAKKLGHDGPSPHITGVTANSGTADSGTPLLSSVAEIPPKRVGRGISLAATVFVSDFPTPQAYTVTICPATTEKTGGGALYPIETITPWAATMGGARKDTAARRSIGFRQSLLIGTSILLNPILLSPTAGQSARASGHEIPLGAQKRPEARA